MIDDDDYPHCSAIVAFLWNTQSELSYRKYRGEKLDECDLELLKELNELHKSVWEQPAPYSDELQKVIEEALRLKNKSP